MFLISNSACSLLTYRKAIGFCILTSYPETLMQSCIHSRKVGFFFFWLFLLLIFWGLFIDNHIICEQTQFYFFLLKYFLSWLIVLVRTSILVLKKSNVMGHPSLVPTYSGKASLLIIFLYYFNIPEICSDDPSFTSDMSNLCFLSFPLR